jgi:uncharacterized membrane protein YraQ (UPF0718 family)
MNPFFDKWAEAAYTSVGFFWMALWAFVLGYAISSMIQVFVGKKQMKSAMGKDDLKSISLGTFFGFISSSCSFSALATTKSLFKKGAGFISSIAFLLASTNLVIELGIVISIFLGWQFVVGEYVGGVLLILISYLIIRLVKPKKLVQKARDRLNTKGDSEHHDDEMKDFLKTENWNRVGRKYQMEWKMVWKDVSLGFTIAGIVAVFVPDAFFESLFINSGPQAEFTFWELLQHTLVGPLAAFLTFIGSMGNIPLAALLFDKGVSFAGVMAFIFSDLVVFPVLRINARYYGWKMSFFILFLLFSSLILTSLLLHYGFSMAELLPSGESAKIMERDFFQVDYSFYLNILFLLLSGLLIYLASKSKDHHHHQMAPKSELMEKTLKVFAVASYAWLVIGLGLKFFVL